MRLTRMSLYSSDYSEAISFSLRFADPEAQYIVRNIVGLDAEDIVPKFYGTGLAADRPKYYDFGLKGRDIVMRIVLNPNFRIDEDYSDVRDQLYRAISATREGRVVLVFQAGATTVASIQGYIAKFEGSYFTETPEVQITIRCDDPMFRGINPVDLDPPVELPPTNPIILPDSLSTAPHGFYMHVRFKAATPQFTVQDVQNNPEWQFKVVPSGGFASGYELYFSSDFANKYLYMTYTTTTREATPEGEPERPEPVLISEEGAEPLLLNTIYLMDKITPASIWPIVFPGRNSFWFPEIANFDWVDLSYYPAYWGV